MPWYGNNSEAAAQDSCLRHQFSLNAGISSSRLQNFFKIHTTMTPTPPTRSSFSDNLNFRFGRPRRQRDVNPFDSSNHATPTHATQPVSPLEDEGAGEESDEEHEEGHEDDREAVDEDEEEGDIEEEGEEGEEEEEGGIEEGAFDVVFLHGLSSSGHIAINSVQCLDYISTLWHAGISMPFQTS
jgi:hypothetical protein